MSPLSRGAPARPTDFDAIVVGARCAGAATAMLLARAGHRVLLVDRARFPSEIPQGHFIHRHGPPRLARWGLLERIVATGCPPVTEMTSSLVRPSPRGPRSGGGRRRLGLRPRRGVWTPSWWRPPWGRGPSCGRASPWRACWPARAGWRASAGARGPAAARQGAGAPHHRRRRPALASGPGRPRPGLRDGAGPDLLVLLLLERRPRQRPGDARPSPAPGDLRLPHRRPPVRCLRGLAQGGVPRRARRSGGEPRPRGGARARPRRAPGERAAARSASTARPTCPTSSAGPTGPAGHWSATPAATRTPSWPSASATPSETPSCWLRPPARASRGAPARGGAGRLRQAPGRGHPARVPRQPPRRVPGAPAA